MMKVKMVAFVWMALALQAGAWALDTGGIPWEEFKMLYKESIERQIEKQNASGREEIQPLVYTIEQAQYRMEVTTDSLRGQVLLSGKILSGTPGPIELFAKDVVILDVTTLSGGNLVAPTSGTQSICFLPDPQTAEFQVGLTFMVCAREDERSKLIDMPIPRAIRNGVRWSLPAGAKLIEATGLPGRGDEYFFSLEDRLRMRYREKEQWAADRPVQVDLFAKIQLLGERMAVTACGAAGAASARTFVLEVAPGAVCVASSLRPSSLKRLDEQHYEIHLPEPPEGSFWVQFAFDPLGGAGQYTFTLPCIQRNTGKQGLFAVEEPEDGQITLTAQGMQSNLSPATLGTDLLAVAGQTGQVCSLPEGESLALSLRRFEPVSAPPVVLDAQYFFTSFEENGRVLSTLVMDVPPEAGERLRLAAVADAQIWSLAVNGQNRKVYTGQAGEWVIGLDPGRTSHVELALLHKGEKIGLQGRLSVTLPATGLAARRLCVGLGLPSRVQLLSLEGPLSACTDGGWKMPPDFIGQPYLFSRSFHRGESVQLNIAYKEPVEANRKK